ncbi:TetR/AcrR family transcriptional regulator [Rhodococcus globerulus]|uniref:TetR/AcrR family transcriptional regulator n=1 Tax=Rhodococcus globerulus TaxID=33008 RepID=UPI000524D40D|nr:TetR/AcrR family transcriptional regulator [Rhodococcus globerulus]PVX59599.1 TetR family transcriptional regulator [Rhodococcus globerulus]
MDAAADRVRTRSGGRSEQVRRAVGEATLAFLAEGQFNFTMVDVAARAGVGRRTVYRWWPSRDDLLVEALSTHVRKAPTVIDTGSWERDLRTLAHKLAEFASDPIEIAISSIMAGGQNQVFNALVITQWEPSMNTWREFVRRAIDRGEVRAECSPSTIVNSLLAPMFLAPLTLRRSMGEADVDALVDLLLSGTGPAAGGNREGVPLVGPSRN